MTGRTSGVEAFWWTLAEFCAGELLPYVFADAEDERNQYTMVVHQVAARLRLRRRPAGSDGACQHRRRPPAAPTTTWSTHLRQAHRRRHPTAVGRAGDRGRAPSTRSSAGCGPRSQPLRAIIRGDLPDTGTRRICTGEPAGHRRRPAQPARTGPAVRRRCRARRRDRPQGGRRARAACCSR